jgi:AcrR family transcriptional regulator
MGKVIIDVNNDVIDDDIKGRRGFTSASAAARSGSMARRTTAPRRGYHHGDLRAALIAAAIELVREHGAAGFSLREAARNVGVDAAACYRHFRDRQEVLVAIAQEGFAKLAAAFVRARGRADGDTARETIVAMGRAYLSFALRHPAQFRVMFGESGLHARDPRLRLPDIERTAYEQLEEAARRYVEAEGGTVDASDVALSLWAAAHGVTRLSLDGAVPLDEAQARALLDRVMDAMLDGARLARSDKGASQG